MTSPPGLDTLVTPYAAWRAKARSWLARGAPPEAVEWRDDSVLATAEQLPTEVAPAREIHVPTRLVDLLERAACHRDPARAAMMYRLLWRVVHGRPRLLDDATDDDVLAVTRLAKAVDRAVHKMRAFVRFREVATPAGTHYVAWFEPEHDVLVRNAVFFVNRFAGMHWTIATPDGGLAWDRHALQAIAVDDRVVPPEPDAAQSLWLGYYRHIFNPARLKVPMMRKEMPLHYWKNLPEAACIPELVSQAMGRAGRMVEETIMVEKRTRAHPVRTGPLAEERYGTPTKQALDACRRCPLGAAATQGVPGAGPAHAPLMLVGEQPGDEEDLAGKPFIGPAGKVLQRALAQAGIAIETVFVTNAVKHFSYEPRGKRRIHKTPAQREIEACRGWLDAEIAREHPRVIVALGATALFSLLGRRVAVGAAREMALQSSDGARIVATYHSSAILRDPDEDAKAARFRTLVADLREAAAMAGARDAT